MRMKEVQNGLSSDDSHPSSTVVQVPTAAKKSVVSWQAPIHPTPLGINDKPESMYSDAGPRTSSSKLAAGSKSLLSRLASPLKSRTRNVYEFHIQLDEPHRQYAPDDIVKGVVHLTILKPTRITHLTVALHGFVRVLKNPAPVGETITSEPAIPISKSRRSQYTGNGHASLFNDEVTLCGEGRLDPSKYEFGFNLRFPSSGIPSSIDFERGTISYLVKATLTRPVSIGAVSTCDRKLSLVENVDIGPTSIPEPRIISLEPILRRPRRNIRPSSKREVQTEDKSEPAVGIERLESTRSADVQSLAHTNESNGTGRRRSLVSADLQSEISEDSGASSSSTGYIVGQTVESAIIPNEAASTATQAGPRKTITAKIELLKAGCLPGDSIPITISIQHTKQIKSLHGIIITFYRLGRIDSAPPLSLFSDLTGKELERLKHEEYYPKSKTGLGGLSLTSPASSGVFRKDLSQTLAPIVIDPATLSTVVSTSIRVPEDVFPTVTGVPGEMISFRYYVEVVVDLGGKLAGQDRHLPRLGMVSLPSMTNPSNVQVRRDISVAPTLAAWGGNIVNTDQIRREKSVVASMFEVLVGSTDSARQRGRGATVSRQATTDTVPEDDGFKSTGQPGAMIAEEMGSAIDDVDENGNSHDFGERDAVRFGNLYEPSSSSHGVRIGNDGSWQAPNSIPMPEPQSTEGLSEKELLRLAETRLLPSQPPKEAGSSAQFQQHATAPPDPDADVPAYEANHANQPLDVAVPGPSNLNRGNDSLSGPSPPPPEAFARPSPSSTPTEDKQELERRRLQAEASSPNDFPHDDDGVESSSAALHISSAPLVPEHDTYGDHLPERDSHGDTLPEYRK